MSRPRSALAPALRAFTHPFWHERKAMIGLLQRRFHRQAGSSAW
jgi:hypothetical protein